MENNLDICQRQSLVFTPPLMGSCVADKDNGSVLQLKDLAYHTNIARRPVVDTLLYMMHMVKKKWTVNRPRLMLPS